MTKNNVFENFIKYFNDNWRFLIKLFFGLSNIYFLIKFGFKFGLGFIYGLCLMGYLFLFPSPTGRIFFDKLFNYSKRETVIMKEESEKMEKQYNEIKRKNKVKFKK